jgi:TetR/AcrR family transcriptional regulator, fatty acid metabolism regulator protein
MRSKIETDGQEQSFIEAARRTQIVDCAIDALAEVGFANTSLAEIAKRAKISKSVILYYFDGKAGLLREVMKVIYTRGFEYIAGRAGPAKSFAEGLHNYIGAEVDFIAEHRNLVRAAVEIAANNRVPEGAGFEERDTEWMFEGLEALFIGGQDAGEFRAFSPRVMAMALRAAIDGISRQIEMNPGFDLEVCRAELMTTFDVATRQGNTPAIAPVEATPQEKVK